MNQNLYIKETHKGIVDWGKDYGEKEGRSFSSVVVEALAQMKKKVERRKAAAIYRHGDGTAHRE